MSNRVKRKIREFINYRVIKRIYLIKEIRKLNVLESGISDDGFPWITLSNGYKFYGFLTSAENRILYSYLDTKLKEKIIEEAFGVAIDIVSRFIYPHAQPTETPPYSLFARRAFHFQHRDTIKDIPNISSDLKKKMLSLFTINAGDIVIDAGAFIGLGALKISSLVESSGEVIAIEADPDCWMLLEKNLKENSPCNITTVPKAIWNKKGIMQLHRKSAHTNSLVPLDHIVNGSSNMVNVQTDTLDNILNDLGITKVSLISMTINGAELEAIEGMSTILENYSPKLSIAGWYFRDGQPVWKRIKPLLEEKKYQCIIGSEGRIYAFRS